MEALTTTAIFPAGSSFAVSSFRRAANLLQHEGIVKLGYATKQSIIQAGRRIAGQFEFKAVENLMLEPGR
jgi:hypothetical protein